MGYYIDLKNISVDKYKGILEKADLIPSRMILKEDIEKNLATLKKHNIHNLDDLQKALKDKSKLQEFSKRTGLSEKYLSVLRVEVNGYQPKPNRMKDFACISDEIVAKLESFGLKNTFQLYSEIQTRAKRNELAHKTKINEHEIVKLAKLTDISRIRWVNHTFAYVLFEAGYDTAEKVAKANHQVLYEAVKQLNEERKIYNAHIGVHDMKLCVESAQGLDFDIEY